MSHHTHLQKSTKTYVLQLQLDENNYIEENEMALATVDLENITENQYSAQNKQS